MAMKAYRRKQKCCFLFIHLNIRPAEEREGKGDDGKNKSERRVLPFESDEVTSNNQETYFSRGGQERKWNSQGEETEAAQ